MSSPFSASSSFPPGTKVEVRFNEAGLHGAWFEAIVIKYASKNRCYIVTFDSLVTDDIPPKPFEDTVSYRFVRPRPLGSRRSLFKLHQLVEAYHDDAWWKGVVIEVPKGADGPYTVRFPLSNEEFEFQGEMVREQLEWVKGKWVPVQDDDDKEGNMMFGVGSQVEVSRDMEIYGATWFVGTILKVISKSYFLVEYESLKVGDDRNRKLLREIVDLGYIRPTSPSSPKFDSFNVLDEVEAYHKNGWLVGVVASILPGSRYIVKSKHHDVEVELDKDLLRPHFDWTMKRWECITQANKSEGHRVGDKVETSQPRRKLKNVPCSSTSKNDNEVADKSGLKNLKNKKAREPRVEDVANSSQPRKKSKKKGIQQEDSQILEGTLKDHADKLSGCPVTVPCSSTSKNDNEVADKSGLKNLKNKKAREPHVEDVANSSQPRKKSKKKGIQQEDSQILEGTLKDHVPKTGKIVEKVSSTAMPMPEGSQGLVNKQNHTSGIYPREKAGIIPYVLPSVTVCNKQDMAGENVKSDQANSREGPCGFLTDKANGKQTVKAPIDSAPCGSSPPGKHVRYPSSKDNVVDDQNNFIQSLLPSEESPPDPTPSITQRDFSEANMIPGVAAPTGLSPSEEHVIDHNELVPSTYSTEKALTETDRVPTGLLSDKIALPFTKGSALWKMFESMEVFRTMPQQPHFHELNNYNVELREGMAVGLMLTFANLVDELKKLQINVSQEVIESKIEALESLESNGFNVSGMRSLLEQLLLEIKCNSQFAGKQVLMEGLIKEKENEIHQLDLSISQQNKVRSELEISMQHCQEKISRALAEKNTKESEVCQLKMDLKIAGEEYLSCAMQFESCINDAW